MTAADPERLLADALRAQAARTPLSEPPRPPSVTVEVEGVTGSGGHAVPGTTTPTDQDLPPRAWWVLGLALLLGLAAGCLVGFLTLLV
ncbi:hypothetical protein [Actinokineospora enzanensis]|uniref:hypothetical protein n=1 Tax=Actinokineospora enzanensis TaxID=155975 RepID=UPI00037F6962|nr:hypothetical protein [Actinokineospora enzanensis]